MTVVVAGAAVTGGAMVLDVDADVMSGIVPIRPASRDVPHAVSASVMATGSSRRQVRANCST